MVLDGGLATTLQRDGLPAYSPVEPWISTHPDRIGAAQRAFVHGGATDVLTATFGCFPERHPDWRSLRDRAVGIARDAGARRVWLALGPLGDPAPVVRGAAVDGVVLETHVDPERCAQDVRRVRAAWAGVLVGCLVPDAHGTCREAWSARWPGCARRARTPSGSTARPRTR